MKDRRDKGKEGGTAEREREGVKNGDERWAERRDGGRDWRLTDTAKGRKNEERLLRRR